MHGALHRPISAFWLLAGLAAATFPMALASSTVQLAASGFVAGLLCALGVDPRRLLGQAYAYGCLSAAWNADGEEEQRDLAIAAAIKQVRQTSY